MNMSQSNYLKLKSIVNSCKSYEQIQSCFSFVNNPVFLKEEWERWKLLGIIQKKAYSLRNEDLAFHVKELKRIRTESFL